MKYKENYIVIDYKFGVYNIKLEQVADVNRLVDTITDDEFNIDERLPYWAEVWPSAVAFAKFILENPNEFLKKRVLELGCGIGLVGIAAALAGSNVLFSDYEQDALDFVNKNYFHNFNKKAKTKLLDWRNPNLNDSFNIILASDVLYENRFLEPVYNTIDRLLLTGGKAYITEPGRTIARPFFEMMKNGFKLADKKPISNQEDKNNSVTLYIYEKL